MKSKKVKSKRSIILVATVALVLLSIKIFAQNKENILLETMNNTKQNEAKYVYPFGKIVGVKADTDGVLVVGYEEENIEYVGGIQKGDNIVEINNTKIENSEDVAKSLENLESDEVEIKFERDNTYKKENIKIKRVDGKPKFGLWVRDQVSGVGTITYYDPTNSKFKAIGHAITDVDTNEFLKIKQGYIYNLSSVKIRKATKSEVGAIKGELNTSDLMGKFDNNSNFGISGNLTGEINSEIQLVEVGTKEDIILGNACILFEDMNRNITSYDINIESFVDENNNDRDMIRVVVDEDLINYTGGIIQGMSGAP
ncbi:MAG: SpoIVB peptidase S55 domain-containing protein, partial [Romboutsia sp.]|uniref:SpoIVB peptidase S55 domain-containing protein n=1 Tax=Romboutsia sp. TaxID=1965302 RepID=UPI003F3408AF